MARGGYRPGAGRKKAVLAARPVLPAEPPKVLPAAPLDASAAMRLMDLVLQGATVDDSGVPITDARIRAARELLPYLESKRTAAAGSRLSSKPVRELTDDELKAIIADDTPAERSGRASGPSPCSHVICPFCGKGFTPAETSAGEASPAAVSEAPGGC